LPVPLFTSILHNTGVVIVGLGVALTGTRLDLLLGIEISGRFLPQSPGFCS
jgi:hypothetical protein